MKKQIITMLSALLFMGSAIHAQQNKDEIYFSTKKTLSTKPAMVKGNTKEVVFGNIPALETMHAMEGNIAVEHNGQKYFYNNGDYFLYNGGRYLLILPPTGVTIKSLPKTMEQVGDATFFEKGIFYKKAGADYEVIKHPLGAVIYNIPAMTDVVNIGDEAYYEYLGVLYKRIFVQGEQAFEVVGELTE